MIWIYIIAGVALYLKMLVFPNPAMELIDLSIVEAVVQDSGVPNTVSGIIFRNRLYDTIFEVVVFTLSIMGVRYLLADEQAVSTVNQFTDQPSIVLARLGATIAALVSIELALRGHLSPGGGFAAGVAGGHSHWAGGHHRIITMDGSHLPTMACCHLRKSLSTYLYCVVRSCPDWPGASPW